jgi:hypothetical protein
MTAGITGKFGINCGELFGASVLVTSAATRISCVFAGDSCVVSATAAAVDSKLTVVAEAAAGATVLQGTP